MLCCAVLSRSVISGSLRPHEWGGLSGPPPGNLPKPGIEPKSPALQADSLLSEPTGKPSMGFTSLHYLSFIQQMFIVCLLCVSGAILVAGNTVGEPSRQKNPHPQEADILAVQANEFSRHFARVSSPQFFPSFSLRLGCLLGDSLSDVLRSPESYISCTYCSG